MGDEQKIWFIYLTDHHEGPFTVSEVSAKYTQNLVNKKTLAWKDGMAEWIAIETIPELAKIFTEASASTLAPTEAPIAVDTPPAEGAASGEEVSLAQMLAQSQSSDLVVLEDSSAPSAAPASSSAAATVTSPDDEAVVWNLRMGESVTGAFSMNQLKEMAKAGELQAGFELWAPGLTNFQPGSSYPQLTASAAVPVGKNVSAKANLSALAKKSGSKKVAIPASVNSDPSDDERTDTSIKVPEKESFLQKVKAFFAKRGGGKKPFVFTPKVAAVTTKKSGMKAKEGSSVLRKFVTPILAVAILGGAGAYYYFFMFSPIPEMEDVRPDDIEQMKAAVKTPVSQGAKFFITQSFSDDVMPVFYVATNLPEGTILSMALQGVPGTLVNAVSYKMKLTAPVTKTKIASFGPIQNQNKPIPMGDYVMTITTDGGTKHEKNIFLGGKKTGPVYDRRMKQYKEKLQAGYDQEIQELREFIQTLKSLKEDLDKKMAEFPGSTMPAHAANSWALYYKNFAAITNQFDQKLKARIAAETPERYYPSTYKDIQVSFGQILQLFQMESERRAKGKVQNMPELNALIQAGIQSLDQFLAQAIVRGPLDILVAKEQQAAAPAAPATPAASAAVPASAPESAPAAAPATAPTAAPGSAPAVTQ